MKPGRKLLAIVGIVSVLGMMVAPVAFAEDPVSDTATGLVEFQGGDRGIEPADINFNDPELQGTQQVYSNDEDDGQWSVTDASGSGAGWHVTIAATDFITATETDNDVPVDNLRIKMSSTGADEACNGTCGTAPTPNSGLTSDWSTSLGKTGSELTLMTAAPTEGMGKYDFKPTFKLTVPAKTYAGTYHSTLTVDIVTGP